MPLRKDIRHLNAQEWQQVTRPAILERDGHRCTQCRIPNHSMIGRSRDFPGYWFSKDGVLHDAGGNVVARFNLSKCTVKITRIVLSVALLDHNPENVDHANLATLCPRCRRIHEQKQHRETQILNRDRERTLLAPLEETT